MNAVWFACEQITSASKHDSSTCESSLLTRRVCWHLASSQSFLHVTCLAGILSLLIPSTKIIFRTQIFNFFCLFLGLLCVCFCFFGLPLVWFRVIWSVGPCVVHFCPSWWSAWQPQNRGKAVRTEIESFNLSRLFSASQTAVTSRKSFVRFRKPFVNFSSYSYLKKGS